MSAAEESAVAGLLRDLARRGVRWPTLGYLVGGAVRDALLGRPCKDFDWVVPDPERAAHELAEALGGAPFEMDAERRHWRVALAGSDEQAGVLHDFAPVREGAGDLAGDLTLRDLTINALALGADGRLIDPTNGLDDLRAGVVRMTSVAAMQADPVRPLRAVRIAAALEFRLEAETLAAVARLGKAQAEAAAAALAGQGHDVPGTAPIALPAMERVGAELNALMVAERAAQGFKLLGDSGLLKAYLPELEAGRDVGQGRGFHHLDVLGHSLEALNQLLHGFPGADLALRWAALLHDLGKPPTRQQGPLGRVTFYGHDKLGAEMAARALRRLRMEALLIGRVANLVRYHMLPLPRGERSARRFVHRRRELLPDLLKLMIADREAARGPLSSEAGRRAYRLALGQVIALLAEAPPIRPLLSGNDVMELLGIGPGPRVGEALALVAEARALGDLADEAEAKAFLQRYARAQGWR